MRRFLSLFIVFSLLFAPNSDAFRMGMGKSIAMSKARDPQVAKYPDILKMPDGLTFYADYENKYGELNAAYSIGSPIATFTCDRTGATISPGTYIDSNGVIQLMPADDNTPRFTSGYYDATGFHAKRGLLIEGQRTNLLTYSSTPENAAWTKTSITAANADVGSSSPDGTATAPSLTATGANGTFLRASGATGQTYSVFIKRKTGTGKIYVTANGGTNYTEVTVTSGWARFQETRASASQTCGIKIETSGDAIYVWNNQYEAAPYMSSPIECPTDAVTRNGDVLKYLISGNRTAAQETIAIKFAPENTHVNDGVTTYLLDSSPDRIIIYKGATSSKLGFRPNATDSGGSEAITSTSATKNTSSVFCGVANGVHPFTYFDGVYENTDADSYIIPSLGQYFYIGSKADGTEQSNAIIQKVAFFNRALSTTEVAQVSELMGHD